MSQLLWQNPVLLRELDERLRTRRSAIMLTVWLLVLGGIVLFSYSVEIANGNQFGFESNLFEAARVGQNIFDWLLFFMVILVLFLVPGFTAASIAGERERQTLLPMQVTLLRPIDIVVGKVAASIVFTLLLIASTMPVLAFVWLVGGVTLGEVLAAISMTAFAALVMACVTVGCSALVRRVPAATVTAYGVVIAMALGSLVVWAMLDSIDSQRGFDQVDPPTIVLAVNPFFGVADVADSRESMEYGWVETPMAAARETLRITRIAGPVPLEAPRIDVGAIEEMVIEGPNGQPMVVPAPLPPDFGPEFFDERVRDEGFPFWLQYVLVSGTVALLALAVATWRVRTPARTER